MAALYFYVDDDACFAQWFAGVNAVKGDVQFPSRPPDGQSAKDRPDGHSEKISSKVIMGKCHEIGIALSATSITDAVVEGVKQIINGRLELYQIGEYPADAAMDVDPTVEQKTFLTGERISELEAQLSQHLAILVRACLARMAGPAKFDELHVAFAGTKKLPRQNGPQDVLETAVGHVAHCFDIENYRTVRISTIKKINTANLCRETGKSKADNKFKVWNIKSIESGGQTGINSLIVAQAMRLADAPVVLTLNDHLQHPSDATSPAPVRRNLVLCSVWDKTDATACDCLVEWNRLPHGSYRIRASIGQRPIALRSGDVHLTLRRGLEYELAFDAQHAAICELRRQLCSLVDERLYFADYGLGSKTEFVRL